MTEASRSVHEPVPDLIDMLGARFELVARLGEADSDAVLFRATMAPGKLVPLHSHADPECLYVISGEIEVFIVGRPGGWKRVQVNQSILLADGVRHAVRNATQTPADLVIATNHRFARFVREAGRAAAPGSPVTPPGPDDIARMRRAAQAFGYWNASPAESTAVTEG